MESTDIAKQLTTISARLERIERKQGAIAKSNKRISRQVGAVEDAVTWQSLINDAIFCFVCATICFSVASVDWIVNNSCSALPAWGQAAVPFNICDGSTGENGSWESHFNGGSDSLAAIAIGNAEGTRTANGGTTAAYLGHIDPGNGVWNMGTFSYQHGASSPEEGDRLQLQRLKGQVEAELLKLEALGIKPDTATILNLADLLNQSPRAGADFPKYLQQCQQAGRAGADAILCARVVSYEGDAPGITRMGLTIEQDQSRRMKAINSVIAERNARVVSSANSANSNQSEVVKNAQAWAGKAYRPGVTAQCAYFVRAVFDETGAKLSVTQQSIDGKPAGEGNANSFFGADVGTLKYDPNELQPGDLVGFYNTYGNFPEGTITHVGIYVGNGLMVDRPTADKPVQRRSIDTFRFAVGVTPRR